MTTLPIEPYFFDFDDHLEDAEKCELTPASLPFLGFDIDELDEDAAILESIQAMDCAETPLQEHISGKKRPGTRTRRRRKRVRRTCTIEGCINRLVQGGVCISHGATRKQCSVAGCDKSVKKAGMCSTHGPARKRCEFGGCSRVAVQGGICIGHGAKKMFCSTEGCRKQALLTGMCPTHSAPGAVLAGAATPAAPNWEAPEEHTSATPTIAPTLPQHDIANQQALVAKKQKTPSLAFQRTMHARAMSIFEEMMTVDERGSVIGNPLPSPPPLHQQPIFPQTQPLQQSVQQTTLFSKDLLDGLCNNSLNLRNCRAFEGV